MFRSPKHSGKIAPRNAGAKPEENRFDKQTIVRRRASDLAFASGQRILDPVPLVIA
jgi:hypothetical protein